MPCRILQELEARRNAKDAAYVTRVKDWMKKAEENNNRVFTDDQIAEITCKQEAWDFMRPKRTILMDTHHQYMLQTLPADATDIERRIIKRSWAATLQWFREIASNDEDSNRRKNARSAILSVGEAIEFPEPPPVVQLD
jgi:hypothetical protein